MTFTPEVKFCVKYLLEHGINSLNFPQVATSLKSTDLRYELVKIKPQYEDDAFFDELAAQLRELWPPGEKDGKYPWRDSVGNLSLRLKVLWCDRLKDKKYSLEECLTVARRYLAKFEHDVKYMQLLKYFIMKQKTLTDSKGKTKHLVESKFADMLEGKSDEDAVQNEWEELINSASLGEGELI